ncbi:hypothetical protein L7F22_019003 [Adiantum nelumboides]|nr:hypothetical protein [Adiantum nelumboides]
MHEEDRRHSISTHSQNDTLTSITIENGNDDRIKRTNVQNEEDIEAIGSLPLPQEAVQEEYSTSKEVISQHDSNVIGNFDQIAAFRFLAGLGGAGPISVGGGALSDIWSADERGKAIALFSIGPLLGPAIGPIAGGFMVEHDLIVGQQAWRWVFYITTMVAAVPALLDIGSFIFGMGIMATTFVVQTYTIDAYSAYAASALAATTSLRSAAAFGFPLFSTKMYDTLGYGWGNTLLAFLAFLAGGPGTLCIYLYGPKLRKLSPYAAGEQY